MRFQQSMIAYRFLNGKQRYYNKETDVNANPRIRYCYVLPRIDANRSIKPEIHMRWILKPENHLVEYSNAIKFITGALIL